MVNYNFKRRSQPLARSHLGELPTKTDTRLRFTKIKDQQTQLKSILTDVKTQTGDEYAFKMQNCYKKNNDVYRKTKIDAGLVKKEMILCEFEIQKTKKKITVERKKGGHLRFDNEQDINEYEFKENVKDKKHLQELIRHKEELQKLYDKAQISK